MSCTHTHTESVIPTSRDETTRSRNYIQRASEGFGFFETIFLISNRVQKAESGLSSVSGLSGAYRQSTARSADSGTVIELFTVKDLSILVIVVLKDPKV